ncbi:hypothetical protein J1TS5_25720 [Paenibacillus macerans]|uniref:DUF7210 family protein n=1 Tax=Paenibacillus macerans TaxID=44252 RepID=UPI001B07105B|nr:hypothetical protein [Paenibacillus macerans]GIP10402.1 hypothetical protein J1TS5_25720 [Paenibacillus macerans]
MEEVREEKQTRKPKASKVTLLKNIKYNEKRYKIGEEIEVDEEERKAFVKAGIIEG